MRQLRLLATDLDGTLLQSDKRISRRTQRALNLARAAGVEIVLVTGRPPRFLRTVAAELEIASAAICGNGALVYDPLRDLVIRHVPLLGTIAAEIVVELREAAPGVCFACERGLHLGCEPEYLARFPHAKQEAACIADALTLCREPISKLIAHHTQIPVQELLQLAQSIVGERAVVTFSGAPFVEIGAPGAQKSLALAWLCAERGIQPDEVIAFGDMPNDLPMLRWAGHSVAMANAHPQVLREVPEVTTSNDEDGVAVVLERLFSL
jgi:Cof subfamily protein (haloacid dehalogenase superfamily)